MGRTNRNSLQIANIQRPRHASQETDPQAHHQRSWFRKTVTKPDANSLPKPGPRKRAQRTGRAHVENHTRSATMHDVVQITVVLCDSQLEGRGRGGR